MVRLHRLQMQGPYREPPEVENPHNKLVEQLHRQEKQSHLQILWQRGKQRQVLRRRMRQLHLQILRQRGKQLHP